MNTTQATVADQDTILDTVAAELASAAYLAALGHGIQGFWIDLELDLWRALAHTVKQCGHSGEGVR
jgi:hypothetical protein